MGKSPKKKTAPKVSSFNFYLLKGEALVYPRGTITPKASPYCVEGKMTELTPEVLKEWFLQSIAPLVGEQAADDLRELFEDDNNRESSGLTKFLKHALAFRQSLK